VSARRARARVAVQDRSGVFFSYDLFIRARINAGEERQRATMRATSADQANVVLSVTSSGRSCGARDAFVTSNLKLRHHRSPNSPLVTLVRARIQTRSFRFAPGEPRNARKSAMVSQSTPIE
jgi:hypothetical protein